MVPPRNSKTKKRDARSDVGTGCGNSSRQFRSAARGGRARLLGGTSRACRAGADRATRSPPAPRTRRARPSTRASPRRRRRGRDSSSAIVTSRLSPGSRTHAREALELARRPRHARLEVAHVDLRHLGAGAIAGVAHHEADLDRDREPAPGRATSEIRVLELACSSGRSRTGRAARSRWRRSAGSR